MPARNRTKIVTLVAVALVCGLGSTIRLPLTDGAPPHAIIAEPGHGNPSDEAGPIRTVAAPAIRVDTPTRIIPVRSQSRQTTLADARDFSRVFADVAEAVTPAVVRIQTERGVGGQRVVPDRLRDMFNLPEEQRLGPSYPEVSGGSGVLVSADGLILTNHHVISGAARIQVTLWDQRTFQATVVGMDPTTDIALIVIDVGGLPAAPLGDSDRVRVGEWVLAIGNPSFYDENALDFTVTSGILSAKGRPLDIIRQELGEYNPDARYAIEDFLQTDAAINPGNSGGPLIDLNGRVIGINTAIASGTGFNQGYGFAVPINVAKRVMDDLLEYGRVRRPLLGISIENVTPEDAEVYRLPRIAGVLVEDFSDRSPAERAGLARHDVIVAIDGEPVERLGQFQRLVARRTPGEEVEVDVIRYGGRMSFRVQLVEADLGVKPVVRTAAVRARQGLGLQIVDLTPSLARQLEFGDPGGALVAVVEPMSPGQRANVAPNTRILAVNRQRVRSAADAERLLRLTPPGTVASLLLEDAEGSTYIANIRVP